MENGNSNSPTELSDLKKLLEENFKQLVERMQTVENRLKENHQEFLSMLKDVDKKAKTTLDLSLSNSIMQTENAEKIESVEFDVSSLKNEIEELKKKNQDLCDEINDTKKRTVRKTLTFWNIIQEQRKESWAESKSIVARDINKVMPEIQLHQILLKIERAHRSTTESHSKYRPIIVRFSNWDFSEDIKSAFIKALKDENRIYVSQMYSPAITFCQNDAMKKIREL